MLRGNKCIGIVKEVYSKWERRSPLTPYHVKRLVEEHGLQVLVQPSKKRVFSDLEFQRAGAVLTEDLDDASVIFGVKQVPIEDLLPERTYVFFSHTIKAQPENMALLDALLEKNIQLIDYECITAGGARSAPRLVAFGEYAGKAGMIDTFRGIGERLLANGYHSPFLSMGSAYMYKDYTDSCHAVEMMGAQIKEHGIPPDFAPMSFIFTGNGNVSKGAQEVFKYCEHEMISPSDLPNMDRDPHKLYGCVVNEEWMVEPIEGSGGAFNVQDYYQNPEKYQPRFHKAIAPYASVLMNCTYWDNRYPRLLTKEQLKTLKEQDNCPLIAVGDISCDIGGSLEFLTMSSEIEDPYFVYNPATDQATMGVDGDGVVMLGVDILPSELPREASHHFGELLTPFVPGLANNNAEMSFAEQASTMAPEMHGAVITSHGELTPSYAYISKMRAQEEASLPAMSDSELLSLEGSTVLSFNGHLYDTGLINQALNVIEDRGGRFSIINQDVQANLLDQKEQVTSGLILQVTMDGGRIELDHLVATLQTLARNTPRAEATIVEMSDYCQGDFSATIHDRRQEKIGHEKDAAAMSFARSPEYESASAGETVLVLGAGLVAAPAIEYLSRDTSRTVVVASALPSEAAELVKKFKRSNVTPIVLDATAEPEKLESYIRGSTAVLSLIPAPLHPQIAKNCIKNNVNLVTASYVSPEMAALREQAREAGVSILCEMGLDPGMDHMSAKAVIDEVQGQGGRVVSFSSVCGGLPAPEAANNPLGYKFSWSPRGVLTAAQNASTYKWNGEIVNVSSEDLLASDKPITVLPSLALEQLPNRDALPYGELYGLDHAHTVYRGTLRYAGWSSIMYNFRQLGLLNQDPVSQLPASWHDLSKKLDISSSAATPEAFDCLQWLGALSESTPVEQRGSVMDAFCALLESKLAYGPNERDMCLMHHEFGIETGSGNEKHTSTFLAYGDTDTTSMAKTVGLTAAVGVEMVLEGVVEPGVHAPTTPNVYKPGLEKLANEGIVFDENRIKL